MTQKHFIEVENGEKVAAVHHRSDSDTWMFFCHGFGGSKERQTEYVEPALENGFNAVLLDFRGNGESDGEFIEQTLSSRIKDLEAVVEHFNPERYVLFGTSFGGKVVLHASTDLEPEAIVVKSPSTYNETMEKFRAAVQNKGRFEFIDGKPIDHRFFEDFDRYSFEDVEEKVKVPVCIFQGGSDTTVHPEITFRAARNLETDVTLHKFQKEKHHFSEEAKQKMFEDMFKWLDRDF